MESGEGIHVERRAGAWVWGALAVIVAVGAGLRFWELDRFSLWLDTGVTYTVCGADSLRGLYELIWLINPENPPVDQLVRYFVMKAMGRGTYWFVFPSAVWSTAGIVMTFLLGRELGGERVGLAAAGLLAAHHLDVTYAQEGRNYAILQVLGTGATLLLVRAIAAGGWWRWVVYGVLVAACFYSHMITCGLAVGHGLFVTGYAVANWNGRGRRALVGFAAGAGVALALFGPWAWLYLKNSPDPLHKYGVRGQYVILYDWTRVVGEFGFSRGMGVTAAVVAALAVAGVAGLAKWGERRAAVLPVVVVAGYAVSYFATRQSFFHVRYVLYALPICLILVAAGAEVVGRVAARRVKGRERVGGAVVAGIVVVIALLGVPALAGVYRDGRDVNGDFRAAVRCVEGNWREGDWVATLREHQPIYSAYTTRGVTGVSPFNVFHTLEEGELAVNRWGPLRWTQMAVSVEPGGDNRGVNEYMVGRGVKRVWVVWGAAGDDRGVSAMVRQLGKIARVVEEREFRGLRVVLYQVDAEPKVERAEFSYLSQVEGLGGPELAGDGTVVRWGEGPGTRVQFENRDGGGRVLRVRVRRGEVPVEKVRVKLNGRVVGEVAVSAGGWNEGEVRLTEGMKPRGNVVELEYLRAWGEQVRRGRGAALARLQVVGEE